MSKLAKVFITGRSQAVRLPKEFRFEGEAVFIRKVGNDVILSPKPSNWDAFFNDASRPTTDFMEQRDDELPQSRELF